MHFIVAKCWINNFYSVFGRGNKIYKYFFEVLLFSWNYVLEMFLLFFKSLYPLCRCNPKKKTCRSKLQLFYYLEIYTDALVDAKFSWQSISKLYVDYLIISSVPKLIFNSIYYLIRALSDILFYSYFNI